MKRSRQVSFKTFRQTTGSYRIKAEVASGSTANMAICRILLLHIGKGTSFFLVSFFSLERERRARERARVLV